MSTRSATPATSRGFTLMETLVMLMLVSMAAAMMFQMLDSYRIARERIAAQAGDRDRAGLFEAWFADTVGGLFPDPARRFTGSPSAFEGVTLNPLLGAAGAPARFAWRVATDGDTGRITYDEDGEARWTLPLKDPSFRFVYYSADGAPHDTWPPELGLQDGLPAGVALVRDEGSAQRIRYVSVRGPLMLRVDPFELERE